MPPIASLIEQPLRCVAKLARWNCGVSVVMHKTMVLYKDSFG